MIGSLVRQPLVFLLNKKSGRLTRLEAFWVVYTVTIGCKNHFIIQTFSEFERLGVDMSVDALRLVWCVDSHNLLESYV